MHKFFLLLIFIFFSTKKTREILVVMLSSRRQLVNSLKLALAFVTLSLLGGCAASLNDFKEMSAEDRANYACSESMELKSLSEKIDSTNSEIEDINEAISKGYRSGTKCSVVPVHEKVSSKCMTTAVGKTCFPVYGWVNKEICHSVKVPINKSAEKHNLSVYHERLQRLETEHTSLYETCHSKLIDMTAEESFNYYEENR